MESRKAFSTPVFRHYIDTRPYLEGVSERSKSVPLPLIESLPDDIQQAISRFIRAPDRLMSLASALLKYQFIHRVAKIPWSEVRVSKTPKPHGRPYWNPPSGWRGEGFEGLDFNVSHQASMVVLVGCRTPTRPKRVTAKDSDGSDGQAVDPNPDPENREEEVRVGVDVACTNEGRRTPDLSTQPKLNEWVDTFAEMFSERERTNMKYDAVPVGAGVGIDDSNWEVNTMQQKARRFYTCWALKEAYIKMVGEGLLADWLRELEFLNVLPPQPGEKVTASEMGLQALLKGKDITDSMTIELEGLADIFLLATMTRGIEEDEKETKEWKRLDIEKDIKLCAEGTCFCLDDY